MNYKIISLSCLLLATSVAFAQDQQIIEEQPKVAISFGILHGGGSLLGADFEVLITDRVGLQIGAGLIGFGANLNYHLKPTVSSSMIALQYWHQGVGDSFTQSLFGPGFIFRSKKLFTASIGLGYALKEGPSWPDDMDQPPVMLTYSLGIYLPVK